MDEQPSDQPQLTKKQRRELRRQEKVAVRQSAAKSKKARGFMTWGGTIIGLGLLIWGLVILAQGDGASTNVSGSTDAVSATDHVRGETTASAVLIEYSDFQCPACGSYEPVLQQLTDEFGQQLALVYRHFPLKSIHPNAEPAALASEAADKQGAFWAYHDLLFDRQTEWSSLPNTRQTFEEYAVELGLDLEQFKSDVGSSDDRKKVNDDISSGNRSNVQGTPTFFLNGERISNPSDIDQFRTLIQNAIDTNAPVTDVTPTESAPEATE